MNTHRSASRFVSRCSLLATISVAVAGVLMGCSAESGAGKADSPAVSASATPAGGVIPGVEVPLSDSLHLIRGKRVEALLPILAQEAARFREESSRYWIYQ